MNTTENLSLTYILPQKAQKHVTHNEVIRFLDALMWINVVVLSAQPPISPKIIDRFRVDVSASGAWIGKDGQLELRAINWKHILRP